MCKLPVEIVDLIIEATVAHGPRLTARCALVCHTWHIISRRHIFHTVALTSLHSPSPLPVLQNNPRLCTSVRQVNIRSDHCSRIDDYDLEVLNKFTKVREVILHDYGVPCWEAVPSIILCSPTLRLLDLKASVAIEEQVLMNMLSRCSENIHHLVIDLVTYTTHTNNKIVTMDALTVLEIRQMEYGFPFGRLLLCPKLQELTVNFDQHDPIEVSFPFVEEDLRHLTVNAGPVRLHRLRFNEKIGISHLTICTQRVYGSFARQIVWAISFARALTTSTISRPVSQLTIQLEHCLPNDCSYPKAREYKPLCDFLRELCRRDKLTRVDIEIQLVSKYQRVDDFQAFKAEFCIQAEEGFGDLLVEEIEFNLTIEKGQDEVLVV